jgi:predicted transcriptional regulator
MLEKKAWKDKNMDDTWEDLIGENKSPKDLFKLMMKEGEVKADDAAAVLGVHRETIDSWVKVLVVKRYAVLEGDSNNPTLKPGAQIRAKVGVLPKESLLGRSTKPMISPLADELAKEKRLCHELQESLTEKEHIIDELTSELVGEKKRVVELEEELTQIKKDAPAATNLNEYRLLFEREQAERLKLEGLLRKKEAEAGLNGAKGQLSLANEEPTKTSPNTSGSIARTSEKALITPRKWAAVSKDGEAPAKPVTEPGTQSTPVFVERPTKTKDENAKYYSDLLTLLSGKGGSMKEGDIAGEMRIDETSCIGVVESLIRMGMLERRKQWFGKQEVAIKKGVDIDAMLARTRVRELREELEMLKGQK